MRILEIYNLTHPETPGTPDMQMVLTDTGTIIPGSTLATWIYGESEKWKHRYGRYPTPEELFTHFLDFTNGGGTAAREITPPQVEEE
jgi:hypothetical protein